MREWVDLIHPHQIRPELDLRRAAAIPAAQTDLHFADCCLDDLAVSQSLGERPAGRGVPAGDVGCVAACGGLCPGVAPRQSAGAAGRSAAAPPTGGGNGAGYGEPG